MSAVSNLRDRKLYVFTAILALIIAMPTGYQLWEQNYSQRAIGEAEYNRLQAESGALSPILSDMAHPADPNWLRSTCMYMNSLNDRMLQLSQELHHQAFIRTAAFQCYGLEPT